MEQYLIDDFDAVYRFAYGIARGLILDGFDRGRFGSVRIGGSFACRVAGHECVATCAGAATCAVDYHVADDDDDAAPAVFDEQFLFGRAAAGDAFDSLAGGYVRVDFQRITPRECRPDGREV